jgi:DNA-binding response OmpR family regulator
MLYDAGVTDFVNLPYAPAVLITRVRLQLDQLAARRRASRPAEPLASPRPSPPRADPAAAPLAPRAGPIHVLVADDDETVRELLKFHLSRQGWTVTMVDNGEEAERLLDREPFDFVLLDLHMPYRSGFDVLAWIRGHGRKAAMKVIMLTVAHHEQFALKAFALGADDFVAKPFSPNVVVSRMQAMLSQVAATA